MESSVCYVQLPNAGQKPALCFRGSRSAYAIINGSDGIIRTIEIDLKDYDKAQRVKSTKNGGEDYSPTAFAEAITRMAQNRVITSRARLLLDKGASLKPDDALPNEVDVMPTLKNEEDDETVEVGVNDEGDATVDGKSHKDTTKPKIRKLPKRINRQGKAEDAPKPGEVGSFPKNLHGKYPKGANGSAGAPRRADPERRPAALLSLPRKPAESPKEGAKAKASRGGSSRTLVAALASEAGLSQQPCRVKLRAAGLRAPYDEKNEAACRKALGLSVKGGKK